MKLEKSMTNMFKKSLVALAVVGVSTTAMAADITISAKQAYSNQTLTTSTDLVYPQSGIQVILDAEYAVGDIIKFTFNSDIIDTSKAGTSIVANGGASPLVLGRLSFDANSVTYRVTEVQGTLSTIGNVVRPFGTAADPLVVNKTKLAAAGSLTVTYSAQTSSASPVIIDAGKNETTLIYTGNQFASSVPTKLDATIDVEQARKFFVGTGAASTSDVLVARATNRVGLVTTPASTGVAEVTTAFTSPVTVNGVKHTIAGDFSWVSDKVSGTAGIQNDDAAVIVCPSNVAPTAQTWAADKLTFTCAAAGDATVTFDITQGNVAAAQRSAINPASFTHSAEFVWNTTGSTAFNAVDAGAWDLNGSMVYIPYMLYGRTAEQTIQLTNKGNSTGDITATAIVGGNTLDLGKVGTAGAKSVTSLNSAIRNAMVAKGVDLSGSNFAVGLVLTTNVPEADVTVYSAYQRGAGDRLVVVNDSNGK
jgi:hypothetical protein